MWPFCSATNPMWLLLPFLIGLGTAYWAWGNMRAAVTTAEAPRRRRSSRRLRRARRTIGNPYEFGRAQVSVEVPADFDVTDTFPRDPRDDAPAMPQLVSTSNMYAADKDSVPSSSASQWTAKASDIAESPDNLMLIKGIGPSLNAILISMGITRFAQIASWSHEDIAGIDSLLGAFSGRILRDSWVDQARLLASDNIEEFERRFGVIRA